MLLQTWNRQFPSSLVSLFQNESKCKPFMSENEFCWQFHFHANQTHFHKNGFALRLALKKRHKETRRWSIVFDQNLAMLEQLCRLTKLQVILD